MPTRRLSLAAALLLALAGATLAFASAAQASALRVFALFSSNSGSLTRLSQVHSCVSILAPNYYHADMTLGTVSGTPDPASLTEASQYGLPLWPVVNSRAYAGALGTSAVIQKLASALAQTVIAGHYAGLTLDFEDLPPADQSAFTSLVQQTTALLHARNIKLAIYTVRPNNGDGAYNRPALAKLADLLDISGYDEHYSTSLPGRLSTASGWQADIAAAQQAGPNAFVSAGAFGWNWPLGGGLATTFSSALYPIAGSGELGTFTSTSEYFFESASDLRARAAASQAAGLPWFGLFTLGREDAAFWNGFQTAGGTCTASPVAVPPGP